jgi:16S rRNA processing protein RimM
MDRIPVGIVARPHGVRGEVRVHLYDPASTTLLGVRRVFVGDVVHTVSAARATAGAILLKLTDLDDRNAVEPLRGQVVAVRRADVPLADGEYLVADLVGCAAVDPSGRALGTVVEVLHGAQDLLVIHDAEVERLLPLVPAFVARVDLAARQVVVDLPEDLPTSPISAKAGR